MKSIKAVIAGTVRSAIFLQMQPTALSTSRGKEAPVFEYWDRVDYLPTDNKILAARSVLSSVATAESPAAGIECFCSWYLLPSCNYHASQPPFESFLFAIPLRVVLGRSMERNHRVGLCNVNRRRLCKALVCILPLVGCWRVSMVLFEVSLARQLFMTETQPWPRCDR